jgi:branched-chain amino acid transport system permease protein
MQTFIQVTVTGLTIGCFYALVALGYTMVYGIVRLINFAHGDLVMVGAFSGYFVLQWSWLDGIPVAPRLLIVTLIAIAITALVSYLLLRLAYRPLIGRSALALMIMALAASLMLEELAKLLFGAKQRIYPELIGEGAPLDIAGIAINRMDLVVIGLAGTLMVAMLLFAQRSTTGAAMRALAVDHDAARLMGINVSMLITAAFVVGAALAAITGVLTGVYYQRIGFDMGFMLGLKAFVAAVVGGIGNIGGAVVGGITIGLLEGYIQGYLSGTWSDAAVFGALILVLYIRPRGLLGERVAERV